MKNLNFTVGIGQRLLVFVCVCVLCIILGSVVVGVITHGGITTPRLRIATVIQDILLFILPAVATAVIICRQPADFLLIRRVPGLLPGLLTVALVMASVPAMNVIVKWNMSLSLPECLGWLEAAMKSAEQSAQEFTRVLIGGSGVKSLIAALLIVGVLAAVSEELFFRGALQQLLLTGGMRVHVAVWTTAVIFSAVHMQFYGFVPRLILGAGFGYLAVWSGSVWLGALAHFTNNAIAAVGMTVAKNNAVIGSVSQENIEVSGPELVAACVSVCAVVALIFALRRSVSRTSCD